MAAPLYQGTNIKARASLESFALCALQQRYGKSDASMHFLMHRDHLSVFWDDYYMDLRNIRLMLAADDVPWILEMRVNMAEGSHPTLRHNKRDVRLITPYLAEFIALAGLSALDDDSRSLLPEDMVAWLQSEKPFNQLGWAERIAAKIGVVNT